MSDSAVTVNVETTENPFGVKGDITVGESVFGLSREELYRGAVAETHRLSIQLVDLVMNEYDRRNARSE